MMTQRILPRYVVCGLVAVILGSGLAVADDMKTKEIKIKDISLRFPASWKREEPKSRLRLAQFQIPAAKGGGENGELAIFSFGASDFKANVRRWISQFEADGRKSKVSMGKAKLGEYVFVEISGTYKRSIGPPRDQKTKTVPGSRVMAVILVVPDKGVYYFKMVGQDTTVAIQGTALRVAFGGDASKEKEINFDEQKRPSDKE